MPQIHELVVVPNDISINNQSQNRVLHIGGLKEYIVNEASKYDMDTVNVIAKTLLRANMDPMKSDRIDYLVWKQQIDAAECLEEEFSRVCNEIKLSEKYRII